MRLLTHVLCSFLLVSTFSLTFAQTVLTGKITPAVSKELVVMKPSGILTAEPEVYKTELKKDGSFTLEISVEEPGPYILRYNRETTRLYLFPEERLNLTLDPTEFDETIKYAGLGKSAKTSNFLAAFFLKFWDETPSNTVYTHLKEDEPGAFQEFRLSWFEEQITFLREKKTELPQEFLDYMSLYIQYDMASDILIAPEFYAYLNDMPLEKVPMPDYFGEFMSEVPIIRPMAIKWMPDLYTRFLNTYVEYTLKREVSRGAEIPAKLKYDGAIEILGEGEVYTYYQALTVYDELTQGEFKTAEELYLDYVMSVPGISDYRDKLDDAYETAKRLAPGQPAPAFTLIDVNGQEISLASLQGKVVYLDFWASWCGPCRREMPFARKLQEAFQGREVAFVYISVDEDENAWIKAMEEEKLGGIHLWAQGARNEVTVQYDVTGIPSYFIIAADGTIFKNDPDRPSGDNVREQIEAALTAAGK